MVCKDENVVCILGPETGLVPTETICKASSMRPTDQRPPAWRLNVCYPHIKRL